MNTPMIFEFSQVVPGAEKSSFVRVVEIDGEPMFVARDVAATLGYLDTDQAVRSHCKASRIYPVEFTGQVRNVKLIPERDVYRLIMRSKLPAAERFEEWVVGEVLPSIRKSGSYSPALPDFTDPAAAARAWADEVDAKRAAQVALEQAKPAIEFVAKYAEAASGNKTFRQVCKLLGANENRFREFLVDRSVIYYLNGEMTPRAQHLDVGRFSVKAGVSNHSEHVYNRMMFTPKGVTWIAGEWGKYLADLNLQATRQRAPLVLSHAHH